ncbi:MAG: hypothetical protein RR891_01150 [Clostridium sp.]|uniref:hypothetical protein n=1 Tax=Clostridium sp. TaxID=1506 RepID=UPI00305568C7
MKYYLVAVVDDKSIDEIISIQKFLNKKYRLYKNISNLYIPLGSVSNVELDKLDEIIKKIISPYKKFKVGIDNDIYINDTSNTVNLKIKDKGYINKICRSMFDMFTTHGISIKEFSTFTYFNMPISNANNAIRKACVNNSFSLDSSKDKTELLNFTKIDKVEIWKQLNNRRDTLVKSYSLKDF